jgi:hypothetical protein
MDNDENLNLWFEINDNNRNDSDENDKEYRGIWRLGTRPRMTNTTRRNQEPGMKKEEEPETLRELCKRYDLFLVQSSSFF